MHEVGAAEDPRHVPAVVRAYGEPFVGLAVAVVVDGVAGLGGGAVDTAGSGHTRVAGAGVVVLAGS